MGEILAIVWEKDANGSGGKIIASMFANNRTPWDVIESFRTAGHLTLGRYVIMGNVTSTQEIVVGTSNMYTNMGPPSPVIKT
jgi:hypothetical protein